MAERRIIGGNLAYQVPNSGSTGLGGFLGDFGVFGTNNGGSTTLVEGVTYDNSDCLKVTITGAGGGHIVIIGNNDQYTGSTIGASALPYLIKGTVGHTYRITCEVYIESATNMRAGANIILYSDQLSRVDPGGGPVTNTIGSWVTLSNTVTITRPLVNWRVSVSQTTSTPGSIVCYFRNIRVTWVTSTRTPVTSRNALTQQRVAVRDMGTALRFDGVNDSVNLNANFNTQLNGRSEATFSVWAKTVSYMGAATSIFRGGSSGVNNMFIYSRSDGFGYSLGTDGTNATVEATVATEHILNRPYLLTLVYKDGENLKLYRNGLLIGTQTKTGVIALSTSNFFVGSRSGGAPFYNGIVDEPRIWNRALTATEIASMYYDNVIPTSGLIGEWLFDEASGTTALDTSGNGNNGTITGTTYTTDTPLQARTEV